MLTQAFTGAQAVFGQTPHGIPEDEELALTRTQAAAVKAAGVITFVFSSLDDVEDRSQVRPAALRACSIPC